MLDNERGIFLIGQFVVDGDPQGSYLCNDGIIRCWSDIVEEMGTSKANDIITHKSLEEFEECLSISESKHPEYYI